MRSNDIQKLKKFYNINNVVNRKKYTIIKN